MSREDRPKRPDDKPLVYGTFSPVYPPQSTIPTSGACPPPSPVPVYPSPAPTLPFYPPQSPAPTSHGPFAPPFCHNRPPTYHAIPVGYQSYGPVVEGIPLREPRLPCCGIGIGWFLFLAGFFFAAVPWYIGAFILLFVGVDYREKAGLIACTVGAVLVAITVIVGLSHENVDW